MLDGALKDVRIALRQLLKSKGFALTAVITLALGLGANTAMFTLINAVLLRTLPVAKPEQLLRLGSGSACCVVGYQTNFSIFSYPLYLYLRDHSPEFEELAAFQAGFGESGARRLGNNSLSEPSITQFVSGNYFSMFGLTPFAGRLLTPADDTPGAAPAAVMNFKTWQQRYGGDRSILGAAFAIDGVTFTVAGIAPPGFFGDTLRDDPPDFWLPLATEPVLHPAATSLLHRKASHWLYIIGRAKPATATAPLEAKVNVQVRQWMMENAPPSDSFGKEAFARMHLSVAPGGVGVATMRNRYNRDLRLLLGITALVLLVACANLANLQLARAAARGTETAVRAALGASRARLIRLTLIENLLLAFAGGAAGVLLAGAIASLLIRLAFHTSNVPIDTAPSLPVLAFAFALSLVTGVVFGVVPAWSGSRADPANALRGSGRSTSRRVTLAQRSLVVVQTALSIVLLAGAGLMLQTLRNLSDQNFGYQNEGRLIATVHAGFSGYSPAKLAAVYDEVDRQLRRISGVRNVAMALYAPMSGDNWSTSISVEEKPGQPYAPSWDRVSRGFFKSLGSRVLYGREFDERDTADSTHVAVVNQAFVDQIFPNQNPIGRRFGQGNAAHAADYQIVGVVENVRFRDPRDPTPPMYFLPLLQMSPAEWSDNGKARSNLIGSIELHVAGASSELPGAIKQALSTIDPNLTLLHLTSMDEQLGNQLIQEQLLARLAELFGILALAVASVGLYGITAYSVSRRTNEIGIRGALGATRSDILGMILKSAVVQAAVGLAIGIPAALGAGRLLADQLYGVQSYDARILGAAAAILMLCACVAGFAPAFQASSIDPARTLRSE